MVVAASTFLVSRHTFLVSGMNGYSFRVNDSKALASRVQKIINMSDMSDQELFIMEVNSHRTFDPYTITSTFDQLEALTF